MTQTQEEISGLELADLIEYDDSDPTRLTHIVTPLANQHIWRPGMSSADMRDAAYLGQVELEALCGHRWIPRSNPDLYKACKSCIDIAGEIMRSNGE